MWDVWEPFQFCLIWVCLGLFTIFIQTALMAVYNSRLGMLVLLLESLLIIDIANSASHAGKQQGCHSSSGNNKLLFLTTLAMELPCSAQGLHPGESPLWNVSVLTQHQELVQSSFKLVLPLALHPIKHTKMLL